MKRTLIVLALTLSPTFAFANCGIIGDSIAVGTASAMRRCAAHAKIGASGNKIAQWGVPQSDTVIVSMGSNPTNNLRAQLSRVASKMRPGARAIWILPVRNPARSIVASFAASRGERAVPFQPSRDNIHPRNYGTLARSIQSHQ